MKSKKRLPAGRPVSEDQTHTDSADPSRRLAEIALSSAGMCGWDWDLISGAVTFSSNAAAIFGADPGNTYAAFRQLIHPDDLSAIEQDVAEAAENHRDFEGQYRVIYPDGSIHWIHARGKFFYRRGRAVRMFGVDTDITEQKNRETELAQAKATLQAQKALLESIVDNIPVLLCYMREPGIVHWVNRTWEETLGWTPEDNGGDLTALLYPDPKKAATVREFIAARSGQWGEFTARTKAGGTIDAEFMNVELGDGINIGIGRDVTVQKRTINELIESGRRFRMLSENIPQMVWIADPQGRTQYYNRRWYEFTGQTPAQSRDYGWRNVMHPDDIEPNQLLWEQVIRDGTDFESEVRLRRYDGEFRWFLVRAIQIRDARGRLERWFGTSTDITERKQQEQRLRRSEARYRTLVEATAQMVWTADGSGQRFGSLEGWCQFTGLRLEDAHNGRWAAALHPDDSAGTLHAWQQAVQTRSVFHHEHRLRRSDGVYRVVSCRAVPVMDDAGNVVEWIGTTSDITDQKMAEQTLIRAEKLATAGRFAATVAHEVNNPLSAVTNIHYILATDQSLPENLRAYLSLADSELRRVSHILRQTLAFYREHSRIQRIRLAPLLEEVKAVFQHRFQSRGIALEISIPETISLSTMPGELTHMLSNLMANAFDVTPKGGRVAVRARTMKRNGGEDFVTIAVADTGIGIPPAHLPHLFEPFFTTKDGLGTGLGLWVTRQLAERNQARIRVRSRVGAGTVFLLELPVTPAPELRSEAPVISHSVAEPRVAGSIAEQERSGQSHPAAAAISG